MSRAADVLSAFTLAAALLTAAPAAEAADALVDCGETVMTDTVLGNNLEDCIGDGILIGAPGITVDLNGHRISGDNGAGDIGIVVNGHDDVTIRNGVVSDYGTGVYASGQRIVIEDMVIDRNTGDGIVATGTSNVLIRRNVIVQNGDDGVSVSTSADPSLSENTISTNGDDGVEMNNVAGARFQRNRSIANAGAGLFLTSTSGVLATGNSLSMNGIDGATVAVNGGHRFAKNKVIGNRFVGIRISSGAANLIRDNRVTANGLDGIHIASADNNVEGNVASANSQYGISVSTGSGNVLRENSASGNSADGIISTVEVEAHDNTANGNGYPNGNQDTLGYGLNLFGGSSGRGNRAARNDATDQCTAASPCQRGSADPPSGLTTCGMPVMSSIKIANNLENCPDGVTVGRPGITIDGKGHRIDGNVSMNSSGIANLAGHPDVTIKNAFVQDFSVGVLVQDGIAGAARRNLVTGIYAADANFLSPGSIRADGTADVTITKNILSGETLGIRDSGSRTTITKNTVHNKGAVVTVEFDGRGTSVSGNTGYGSNAGISAGSLAQGFTFSGNTLVALGNAAGIGLFNVDNVTVTNNSIFGATSEGIYAFNNVADVTIRGNRTKAVGREGIKIDNASEIRVLENAVTTSDDSGIVAFGTGVRVLGNRSTANGQHGIQASGTGTTVRDNTANGNGQVSGSLDDEQGLGIEADPDTPGGGNTAKGNDDDGQCEPTDLC